MSSVHDSQHYIVLYYIMNVEYFMLSITALSQILVSQSTVVRKKNENLCHSTVSKQQEQWFVANCLLQTNVSTVREFDCHFEIE